jgi:hypothetical protein
MDHLIACAAVPGMYPDRQERGRRLTAARAKRWVRPQAPFKLAHMSCFHHADLDQHARKGAAEAESHPDVACCASDPICRRNGSEGNRDPEGEHTILIREGDPAARVDGPMGPDPLHMEPPPSSSHCGSFWLRRQQLGEHPQSAWARKVAEIRGSDTPFPSNVGGRAAQRAHGPASRALVHGHGSRWHAGLELQRRSSH